ncbi:MAG TPA: aminoacylase [Clostridiales bacterium]|nr:aminoacylase [Clostridiales bacterium]
MLDLLIKNGTICDGSGKPSYRGDIGVKDKKIVAIGSVEANQDSKVIEAEGLVVSPGFIDFHTHSDLALLGEPSATAKITQGVTTEIIGHCGISAFPFSKETYALSKRYTSSVLAFKSMEWDWLSLGEYFALLSSRRIAVNVGALIGHGSLRIAVMGFENRKPTHEDMSKMKGLLIEGLEQGAFGLSTGLAYVPGCYADLDELSELTEVVAQFGGIYSTHLRNQSESLVECVEEAIEIGRRTGASIQISHLKAVGKMYQSNAIRVLDLIEKAQIEGIDVTADQYPYLAGSSTITAILPPWVLEGGMDEMLKRLQSNDCRKAIKYDLLHGIDGWENRVELLGWENIFVSSLKKSRNKHYEGKNLEEIAIIGGKSPEDTLFDLLIDESGNIGQIAYTSSEDTMRIIMKSPYVMIGSDGLYVDEGKTHPRLFGTFPRLLGKYVREEHVITLEEAIRKITYLPAKKLGFNDRGLIKEGMMADITIFDKNIINDNATFSEPFIQSEGIKYVIVNGELILENGQITGKLPGTVIRRG